MRAGYWALLLLLALVTPTRAAGGWYLMYPAPDPPPKDNRSSVPLRNWIIWGSFDSANECEAIRGAQVRAAEEVAKGSREEQAKRENDPKLNNDPRFVAAMRQHVHFNELRQEHIVSEIDHEELRLGSMEQFEAFIRVLGDAILRTAS